ncbi:MAG: sensor histidine kinase [Opitutaceae bacterium]|nr:sensor histidine kinase [Opitutaceae bacterium]
MTPLTRLVAMALFIVLLALAGLLAVPLWQSSPLETRPPAAAAEAGPAAHPAQARALSQRLAFMLATGALGLAVALIFLQMLRPAREPEPSTSPGSTRTEVGALARLAESNVAQGAELSRERDVRRRAEEDARLKQELLAQALEEKIDLGRDLHDGIIQSLYATGLNVETVRALVKTRPDEAEQRLDQMRAGLNATIRDVRAYIIGLAPDNLRRAGFAQALSAAITELASDRNTALELTVDNGVAAQLPPEQAIETLQIAREAVSNALRHGRATAITLRLGRDADRCMLQVADNGAGFDPARAGPGHGLGNMRARAARLGGTLTVESTPGQGARLSLIFPHSPSATSA